MKKLLIVTFFAILTSRSYAQDKVENVNEYLYNEAYKNVTASNIRYANYSFNGVDFQPRFSGNYDMFYRWFFPPPGYKLKMKFDKSELLYPNEKFQLYKIHLDGFSYVPEDHTLPEIGSRTPTTTNDFLIALNVNNGEVKFVSGEFFASHIAQDFKVDLHNPASLLRYVTMRAFAVGGKDILFKKKKHKGLVYVGYSELSHCPFEIWVSKKDPNDTHIIVHNNGKL